MFENKVHVTESEDEWEGEEEYCNSSLQGETVIYYGPNNSQGYISYRNLDRDRDRDIVELNKLFVRKDCRNKGIGSFLVKNIPSCKRLVVQTFDAHDFYLKCGFVVVDNDPFWLVKYHHKQQQPE